MEDQERIEGTEEDVEGHRRAKKVPMAGEEPTDEAEEAEDVEGHRRAKKVPMAGEEPADEAEEAEDVEAHALRNRPQAL